MVSDIENFDDHEIDSFTSRYSGADVHLYSNREDPFESYDMAVIDELMHASLDERVEYSHLTVGQFMDCARDRILVSRGGTILNGERINVYIHADPEHCWSNGTIQRFPANEGLTFKDFCDSRGMALKDAKITMIPGLLAYEQTWIINMTHRSIERNANGSLSASLLHEPVHLWQQYLGLPFKYDPNERLANFIEGATVTQLYPQGIPNAVFVKAE